MNKEKNIQEVNNNELDNIAGGAEEDNQGFGVCKKCGDNLLPEQLTNGLCMRCLHTHSCKCQYCGKEFEVVNYGLRSPDGSTDYRMTTCDNCQKTHPFTPVIPFTPVG